MKKLLLILILSTSIQAWSHGEDKLGSHGGYISMPGPFHVELVPVNSHQLKVFLLDMSWKNPSVKNSSTKISYGGISARCNIQKDHFVCDFPAKVDLTKQGEIKVDAVREEQKGNTIKYALPLKLEKMKH